jgi:signal transduction histidine kinase
VSDRLQQLAEQYTQALDAYVKGAGETELQKAYNLGREAIVSGIGVLDIAAVYQEALLSVLLRALTQEESTRMAKAAAEFFIESLSPFEMAQRGYQAANTTLLLLNETSKEREQLLSREQSARAEAEAAQQRLRFLADASTVLDSSLDYATTLASIPRIAVPFIADWCVVYEVEDELKLRRVGVTHTDPAKSDIMLDIEKLDLTEFDSLIGTNEVLQSGRSKFVAKIPDFISEHLTLNPAISEFTARYGLKSYMIIPLVARQRILGIVLAVSGHSGRRFSTAELQLAEDLARRAALAVDNARLYSQSQRTISARDELLSIIAHDLRNPLGVILMSTLILLRSAETSDRKPPELQQLNAIRRSAERMNRLIQDLLDIAKIEAGHFSVEPKPHTADSIVADAMEMLKSLAEKKHIEIETMPNLSHLNVLADRERMFQVFSNIVGNAIKFTPENGHITLSAVSQGNTVEFAIRDNGPGIPVENLSHIFDRFWQARNTARLGTGLGLSIAKGIITAHGGNIWAESEMGAGATFFFTLPRA